MEEEEARLKALLDQTSDFDERKKIRADLRALRMKKLDAINSAAAVESSERAARRAERARARRAEQTNGEVSRGERDSNQAEVVISEQILAEINDEETLQKLLNEIPTSQLEDRRRIRARIREVRRKKPEEETTTRSTYSRRTKEVTEEPSGVTVETSLETHSIVANHSGGDDEMSFKVTVQQPKDMNGEVDGLATDEGPSEEQEVVAQSDGEKEEEKESREDIMVNGVDEQVGNENEEETGHEEIPTEEAAEESIPNEVPVEQIEVKEVENEPVEEDNGDGTEETNEEPTEEVLSFEKDKTISLEITLDEKVEINVPVTAEEPISESKTVDEEPKTDISHTNDAEPVLEENGRQERKDSATDSKPASKSARSSRWPPPEEDKAKKPGRVNTTDFRGNLKKSGRIGPSAVNLEKKTTTAGAQVDFRASSLKKSGRYGTTGSQERKDEPIKQEKMKEVESEPAEETNDNEVVDEQSSEDALTFGKDGEISLQIKLDEPVEINVPDEEEKDETESRTVDEEPQDKNDEEPPREETKVEKIQPKDTKTDTKPAPKSTRNSRWPPAEDDKSKKPGKINTADFRGNLKKSGRIGSGPVNLEKKPNTAGAQVDFRASSLKKSGRFGATATKQERKDEPIKQEKVKEVESEPAEEANDKDSEEINEQPSEVALTFGKDSEISLQIKLDEQVEIDLPVKDEDFETEAVSEEPQETTEASDKNDAKPLEEQTDGQKPREDTATNTKQAPKSAKNWPPPEDKTKKPGQINTADFRGNLKKSGRIGSGVVNLENKTTTTGAQVDFRASSLKKSGRIGTGVVNLERRTVQSGAQVDFRSGLKQTGKSPAIGRTPISTDRHSKSTAPQGKADFGKSSKPTASVEKKDDSPPDEASAEPEEAPIQPEVEPAQPEAEPAQPEAEPAQPEEPTKPEDEPAKAKVAAPSAKVGQREIKDIGKSNRNARNFQNLLSNAKTKDKVAPPPVKTKLSQVESKSEKKRETEKPTDTAVNGVTVQVENTSLEAKEPTPEVKIEVTEHVEDEGDTQTEVREVNTSKKDGDTVEEKKEVTTVSKTSSPGGRQMTYQKRETTTTTKKTFVDPELQKRLALRQRERMAAKKEQVASAKNKRMAFMQKLEANSPASKGPTQIKRSGSNVDKLLAWCRFKTRGYEGLQLSNFSSSWADGLAFCALLHLYLPDEIPYDELRAANDRRRNFETAFRVATEAGVPELLEVDDMLSVQNPEPKSVMTYVSSIYKHFNPS